MKVSIVNRMAFLDIRLAGWEILSNSIRDSWAYQLSSLKFIKKEMMK